MVSLLTFAIIFGLDPSTSAAATAAPPPAASPTTPAAPTPEEIKHGARLFNERCLMCHTATAGDPNKAGPNLFAVVGRKAASLANFHYSAAMRASNLTWTPQVLDTYLQNPQKLVPGTFMTFAGFSAPADAADLVAYLQTKKPAIINTPAPK